MTVYECPNCGKENETTRCHCYYRALPIEEPSFGLVFDWLNEKVVAIDNLEDYENDLQEDDIYETLYLNVRLIPPTELRYSPELDEEAYMNESDIGEIEEMLDKVNARIAELEPKMYTFKFSRPAGVEDMRDTL
jgi:hypothetical protein